MPLPWVFFSIYYLSVIVIHLLSIFIKLQPVQFGYLATGLAVLITSISIWNATYIRDTKVDIPISGLTKEIKAVHLTDIHIGHFWGIKFLQRVVDKTNAQKPDVVFITGDFFDGRVRLSEKNLEPLKQITVPIFFVEGNHDGYTGTREIKSMLRKIGIHVLENELAHYADIQIIGLDHMRPDRDTYNMHASPDVATIKDVLPTINTDTNKPTILLHHSPDGIKYANQYGIDLYLAGHTHAGQMFPANILAKYLFDYNRGLHDYKGTKIFVSEGVGTFGPPMRLGTKSEIVTLILKPKN